MLHIVLLFPKCPQGVFLPDSQSLKNEQELTENEVIRDKHQKTARKIKSSVFVTGYT